MIAPRWLVLVALASTVAACQEEVEPEPKARVTPASSKSPSTDDAIELDGESDDALDDEKAKPRSGETEEETPTETPAGPVEVTHQCGGELKGHSTLARLTFTIDGANVDVTKLEMDVTNASGNNDNDITVFVTPPGGQESEAFSSGDILTSGKTTSVPLPSNFKPKLGSAIRILTYWDESFRPDPKGWCTIKLTQTGK